MVCARMDPGIWKALKIYAAARGRTIKEVIEHLVVREISTHMPSALDEGYDTPADR